MKNFKRPLSVFLAALMLFSTMAFSASATSESYTINNPYSEVKWGEWKAYKGNLHTHSSISDASTNQKEMIMDYYNQGFDFLAMTDHGVTGKAWNETPTQIPLYLYQWIIGLKPNKLTDEEFEGVTTGTWKLDENGEKYGTGKAGEARGYGMTCVTGGNELNALTLTKCHVNAFFPEDKIDEHVGDNHLGYENDHEGAVELCDENGGISFINHPGDWLNSNDNPDIVNDPEKVHYFSNILLKYNSCYGMEIFNERNGPTGYDRILWDNVLMECLPYGKNVIAYSNGDSHWHDHVDSSWSIFMMEDNTVENIKKTMKNGAFFCITRSLRANDVMGPETDMSMIDEFDVPVPTFTYVGVEDHTITIKAKDLYDFRCIANGKVIKLVQSEKDESGEYVNFDGEQTYTINLDDYEDVDDFLYVRFQLIGKGGINCSQAFTIDDGSEPLEYVPDETSIAWKLSSLRIVVLFKIIANAIAG